MKASISFSRTTQNAETGNRIGQLENVSVQYCDCGCGKVHMFGWDEDQAKILLVMTETEAALLARGLMDPSASPQELKTRPNA